MSTKITTVKQIVFLQILFLTSCISTNRFTKIVSEQLVENYPLNNDTWSNAVEIKADSLPYQDSLVKVTKSKSYFIPLVVVYFLNHNLQCTIKQTHQLALFKKDLALFMQTADLLSKLKNKRLEIEVLDMPNTFNYFQKQKDIFLIFGYVINGSERIYPKPNNHLTVRYNLFAHSELQKTGILSITNSIYSSENKNLTTKKFIQNYVEGFENDCSKMNDQLFEKLLSVLE